jgi:hypothetical protein
MKSLPSREPSRLLRFAYRNAPKVGFLLVAYDPSVNFYFWFDTVRVAAGASARHDLSQPDEGEMACWNAMILHAPRWK